MSRFVAPLFNIQKLREPERLIGLIRTLKGRADLADYHPVADVAQMMITSSATNDYLEKIGAEAVGGIHSAEKLGPDGYIGTDGLEIKPRKGKIGEKTGGVINDDTPMKLEKDNKEIKWIVFLNAEKDGSRINYAVVAPFHYWNADRYKAIVQRLELEKAPSWAWGCLLPETLEERTKCFEDLLKQHKERTYVRSSPLSLEVLRRIPAEERRIWVHPDVNIKNLPACIRYILLEI